MVAGECTRVPVLRKDFVTSANAALEQFIRTIPLFEYVEAADLGEVLRLFRPVELAPGQALFREGEPGKAMWVLGTGTEVTVTAAQGRRRPVVVAYSRPGDVIGEMALVDDGPRSGSAIVTSGGPAHQIDAADFHAMRSTFAPAAFKVLRKICVELCARLRATNDRIVPPSQAHVSTPHAQRLPRPELEVLERFPPFRGLPAVVKLALAQQLELVKVDGITPVFAEGEATDGAYFLVAGEVSVGRGGKTLANLPAGTMFGIVACIDRGTRSASCVTTGPATLLRLSDAEFDRLFASGHRFAFQLVDLIARQLVQHVRDANTLVPPAGRASAVATVSQPMKPMLPAKPGPEDLDAINYELDVEVAMPLELEIELGDFQAESSLLG